MVRSLPCFVWVSFLTVNLHVVGLDVKTKTTTKSASLGGQQHLDCELNYPNKEQTSYFIKWKKNGIEDPIYIQFINYPPNIHPNFYDRINVVEGSATLEINHILESDEGWYECTITYIHGAERTHVNGTWIYLKVHTPPSIVASTKSYLQVHRGATVSLFCRGKGSPTPKHTWTKDGQTLANTDRITIKGSNGDEVEITNLQRSDGGQYRCILVNSIGSVQQEIKLVVEGGVYIMGPPVNTTAVEGQRVQFRCEVEAYPKNITYHWYKDGLNIKLLPSYKTRVLINRDGSLVITSVIKEDMAWYSCMPSNGISEEKEASAYLNVTYLPKILSMPSRLIWAKGYPEQLDCHHDANPPITAVIWLKDSNRVSFQNSDRIVLLSNGTLYIKTVEMRDGGIYSCTPISPMGTGTMSPNVQVIVRDPPYFIIRPLEYYQRKIGESLSMACDANGTPKPLITWRKVGSHISLGSRIVQSLGNLTILELQKEDHGSYECVASNEIATIVTGTDIIIENATPHAPYNVAVQPSLFSATISWMPAYQHGPPEHYVIWYRNLARDSDQWQTIRLPNGAKSFTVHNLEPDTLYEFMVLSRNQYGDGMFSERVRAHTSGYVDGIATALPTDSSGSTYIPPIVQPIGPRPLSPTNISAVLTEQGILIHWAPPTSSTVPIFYYVVEYQLNEEEWKRLDGEILVPTTSFLMTDIYEGNTYRFRVVSYGVLAYSTPSFVVNLTIPDEDSFLSDSAIGGIVGGLCFLIIAILIVVVVIVFSRKKQRKRDARYGNVKYSGTEAEENNRTEYAPKWDRWTDHRRGDPLNRDIYTVSQHNLEKPGEGPWTQRIQNDPDYSREFNMVYDPVRGYRVPIGSEPNSLGPNSFGIPNASYSLDSTVNNSDNRLSTPNNRLSNTIVHQPLTSHSLPSPYSPYDTPSRAQDIPSSPHDMNRLSHPTNASSIPNNTQSLNNSNTLTNQPQGYDGPYNQGDSDDDNGFASHQPRRRRSKSLEKPEFTRHSSAKPLSSQTYLTDDFYQPDVSSVLPSPFSDNPHPRYGEFSPSYTQSPSIAIGAKPPLLHKPLTYPKPDDKYNDSYNTSRDSSLSRHTPHRRYPRSSHEDNSSESSGRPVGYTRDKLQGAVDRIRKNQRPHRPRPKSDGYHGPRGGDMDTGSFGKTPFDSDSLRNGTKRASISDSGLGSNGNNRPRFLSDPPLRRSGNGYPHPDSLSQSSGLGSHGTSHSASSPFTRHPKNSLSNSSLTTPHEQDMSAESSPFADSNSGPRRDNSADENYEFDSITALESDLMDAIKNYSQLTSPNGQLASALQSGLSATDFYNDLYPKPRRQSRYSDSEQRFERLREEFQQHRQSQQESYLQNQLLAMDSDML